MKLRKSMVGQDRQDRGAVMIWFAASVVVSLGMGALVVDVGALWSERRQLQNGADAAALAVAIECATGPCVAPMQVAQEYANLNTNDGTATIDSLCGKPSPLLVCSPPPGAENAIGFVEVITGTRNGGSDEVKYLLAPVLDGADSGEHVTARAVAAWGVPGGARALAMVISKCNTPLDGTTDINLETHNNLICPDGRNFPQGFDYVDDTAGGCLIDVSIIADNKLEKPFSGNNPDCSDVIIDAFLSGEPLLIPVAYEANPPSNGGAWYKVDGFALVRICGFRLPGSRSSTFNSPNYCDSICPDGGGTNRICGMYVRGSISDGDFGSGEDYGVRVIKLIG